MNTVHALKQSETFAFIALALMVTLILVASDRERLIEQQSTTPPIVVLSEENQAYRFELGSADVSDAFASRIREHIAPLLDSLSRFHKADVVEVIGHTDAVPVGGRSTLDRELLRAYERPAEESELRAGSNVDLGILRALTVIRYLREAQTGTTLGRIDRFVPYSAGQMILPDGELASTADEALNPARRRIEIRLRRKDDARRATLDAPAVQDASTR